MRIISDELFARLVKELAKDEKVAIFQQLLLSPKKDETAPAEEENTEEPEEDILFPEHIPMTDEEIDAAAREFYEEAKKNFIDDGPDVKDYLCEIALTLKSINEKMERMEKELAEFRK